MEPRRTHTVLLLAVDCERRRSVAEALELEGHAVVTANSTLAAVAVAESTERPPTVLVTDQRLDSDDGTALERALSRRQKVIAVFIDGFQPGAAPASLKLYFLSTGTSAGAIARVVSRLQFCS